jgi:hypothetical protein
MNGIEIQIENDKKNQSDLHSELAYRGIRWIANRSTVRGMQTGIEIFLDRSYVVDSLAIGDLQLRFWDNYIYNTTESLQLYKSHPIDDFVFIFESKVSRADFLSTFTQNGNLHDNRLEPIGNLHWVVTPKDMIKSEEVPDFWGLLEASGSGLREVKKPKFQKTELSAIHKIAYLLLRYKHKYGYPENLERLKCPDCSKKTGEIINLL